MQTNVNLTLPNFYREFTLNGTSVFSIDQLSSKFESNIMSGFLGIAPYTKVELNNDVTQRLQYNESLMYQIYNNHNISNMIVSFYVNNQAYMTTSFMKFGSYDKDAFDDSARWWEFETASNRSWALNMKNATFSLNSPS